MLTFAHFMHSHLSSPMLPEHPFGRIPFGGMGSFLHREVAPPRARGSSGGRGRGSEEGCLGRRMNQYRLVRGRSNRDGGGSAERFAFQVTKRQNNVHSLKNGKN